MLEFLTLAVLALGSFTGINALSTWVNSTGTGFPPCDALVEAGLGPRLLFATDPAYELRIESYWALNTRRHPYCLVQPHNAKEVAIAVTVLLGSECSASNGAGDWHIAVRAGGHNLGYSNNIENGVTIDLKYLNRTTYDARTNIASLSPGSHWQDVYATLYKYGVVVTGGRDGNVGVGGFLLGGGSTYYMAQQGFGCDSIVNFEVVLVNGTIIDANKNENSDLWRALKGGGSNFSIVTRYDMEVLEDKTLAHGVRTMSANYSAQFVDAVVDFTDTRQYDNDALIATLLHTEGEDMLATIEANIDGVQNTPRFDNFRQIPQTQPFTQTLSPLYKAAENSTLPGDSWALQVTLTFKNDKQMLNYAARAHKKFAQDLQQDIGPLPSFFAEISEEKGGNMFADSLRNHNAILWTSGVFVYTNQSDFAVASKRMHTMVAGLESYSASIGADNQLVYLNYADFSQDPLGSYPKGSVDHMRNVATKYDPEEKFQTRFPGGFKISRVDA